MSDFRNIKKYNTRREVILANPDQLKAWAVDIMESERGWGQKIDDTHYFLSEQEARDFERLYNKEFNSKDYTPSWYMQAMTPYEVKL